MLCLKHSSHALAVPVKYSHVRVLHANADDESLDGFHSEKAQCIIKQYRIEYQSVHPTLSLHIFKMGAVRKIKTKRRTRDYDQVRADIDSPKHLTQYKATKDAEDLPGLGKHYCVECSKWFESEYNLVAHTKGKNHKRRLRLLREEPHSQKIAEAAVGLSTDNGLRQQETVVDMED